VTRKLLMTAVVVAMALTPLISIGTAEAHGGGARGGGSGGDSFHGGGFHGGGIHGGEFRDRGFFGGRGGAAVTDSGMANPSVLIIPDTMDMGFVS
jgi:hypothetical protein